MAIDSWTSEGMDWSSADAIKPPSLYPYLEAIRLACNEKVIGLNIPATQFKTMQSAKRLYSQVPLPSSGSIVPLFILDSVSENGVYTYLDNEIVLSLIGQESFFSIPEKINILTAEKLYETYKTLNILLNRANDFQVNIGQPYVTFTYPTFEEKASNNNRPITDTESDTELESIEKALTFLNEDDWHLISGTFAFFGGEAQGWHGTNYEAQILIVRTSFIATNKMDIPVKLSIYGKLEDVPFKQFYAPFIGAEKNKFKKITEITLEANESKAITLEPLIPIPTGFGRPEEYPTETYGVLGTQDSGALFRCVATPSFRFHA